MPDSNTAALNFKDKDEYMRNMLTRTKEQYLSGVVLVFGDARVCDTIFKDFGKIEFSRLGKPHFVTDSSTTVCVPSTHFEVSY